MNSTSSNNDNVQYFIFSSTSNILIEFLNDNAITNNNAQNSTNDASNKNVNNNANDIFNNVANKSFNIANQEFDQPFNNTRQIKSFVKKEKIAFKSFDFIEDLNQKQFREQQHYEIDWIINDDSNETFEQFHHANKVAMTQIYK